MTTTKRLIAAALSGALLLPTVSLAEAGPRDGWRGHPHGGWHGPHRPAPPRHHGGRRDDAGAALAAGIIGLAAGAVIVGAMTQPARPAPLPAPSHGPAYGPSYGPAYGPVPPAPGRVYDAGFGYQPWSPAWYRYCADKYRSFNPSTGTYTTYAGEQRFCQ
ncbi:BA14K family protein [Polymorphum gilvum]|uniref:Lectin-like protein BA14k n=1 Tax=Polymorphum gilvum (strain LMG 25793 / CGMCC 1.9160 / SL003B-26A1) TaxID=991905 RepID=F2J1F8_POLGS|nr:BA14K family protein [Polymorphum gilvum]ADZ69740.1 Glutelin:Proline-rich region [Polymorphum gilvum SL003B-26A1]